METRRKRTARLSLSETYFLAICAIVVAGFMLVESPREPIASAETRFVEHSKNGLHIVPASCASDPGWFPWPILSQDYEHYPGECSDDDGCPEGWTRVGDECVPPDDDGGPGNPPGNPPTIVPPGPGNECPVGYILVGNLCFFSGCPDGYVFQGGQCVLNNPAPQCSGFFCQDSQLRQRVEQGGQCTSVVVQNCAFGCGGSRCLAAPSGEGAITVSPALIRSGETTTVSWVTNDMVPDSCTVVENNPDINDVDEGPSGSFVSSQIRQQTSYTLRCTRQDDSIFTDSATVNILPVFQED